MPDKIREIQNFSPACHFALRSRKAIPALDGFSFIPPDRPERKGVFTRLVRGTLNDIPPSRKEREKGGATPIWEFSRKGWAKPRPESLPFYSVNVPSVPDFPDFTRSSRTGGPGHY